MGSRKSTEKTKSDSASRQDYIDWTKGSGQKALDDLNNIYDRGKSGSEADRVYQGGRVIDDFNPETNSAMDAVSQNARAAGHTATDIHDLTEGAVNPYFEQSLQDNLGRLGDRLTNSAAYGGYGSSDTERLVGREMSSALTGAMNEQWNAAQDRRLKANAAEQQAYQGLDALQNSRMNAAGKRDVLSQAQLDAAREKWNEGRNFDWQNLGKFIDGLNSIRSGTGQSETHSQSKTTARETPSGLDIAAGIAGLGADLFGGSSIGGKAVSGLFGGKYPPAPKEGLY